MKTYRSALLIALGPLLSVATLAQSECQGFHKFNCERAKDGRFNLNGQSKSASVQVGVPTELNIIVYNAHDYRISFCYDPDVIGDHVVARLIEKVRVPKEVTEQVESREEILDAEGHGTGQFKAVTKMVKRTVFEDERKVLWDNQEHEMTDEVEFSSTATKRLMVEVTAPGATNPKTKGGETLDIGCIGILIEHMPTPAMGFGGK